METKKYNDRADWIKFYPTAMHHPKIKKLIRKYGIEGWGIYFAILGELISNIDFKININELVGNLNYDFKIDEKLCRKIINEFDLFEIDGEIISNDFVLKEMKSLNAKRLAGSKGGSKSTSKPVSKSTSKPVSKSTSKTEGVKSLEFRDKSIENKEVRVKSLEVSIETVGLDEYEFRLKEIFKDNPKHFDGTISTKFLLSSKKEIEDIIFNKKELNEKEKYLRYFYNKKYLN